MSETSLNNNRRQSSLLVKNTSQLPGDLAMWIFIVMELSVFALFFIAFAVAQRLNTELFALGRATLDMYTGLFCTIALIVGSYFVALSVDAIKHGNNSLAKKLLMLALASASVYLWLKVVEYQHLMTQGFELSTNTFYTLYFFITGFHYMHVLLGMVILGYMLFKAHRQQYTADNCSGYEAGASYWHMVDLVWVIVFFLIYIIH
jgi:nitric oxide reductase NorE protein